MQSENKSKSQQQKPKHQPSIILGLQRTGVGEVALLKQNPSGDWEVISQDIFAVIQGKLRELLYNEVFLR